MYHRIVHGQADLDAAMLACKRLLPKPDKDGEIKPYILTFQKLEEKRRAAQNRRYWALLHQIAEQVPVEDSKASAETWHEWMKRRFIGVKIIPLPDGIEVTIGLSTTRLSVGAFSDYMMTIEAWAIEIGVIFNDLPEAV